MIKYCLWAFITGVQCQHGLSIKMSKDTKLRTIGARKAPEPLTMSALLMFAERVIRTDKDAALRAQNSVSDLDAKSNDGRPSPRVSGLSELCAKSGSVKIKSDEVHDEDSEKLVTFAPTRRGS